MLLRPPMTLSTDHSRLRPWGNWVPPRHSYCLRKACGESMIAIYSSYLLIFSASIVWAKADLTLLFVHLHKLSRNHYLVNYTAVWKHTEGRICQHQHWCLQPACPPGNGKIQGRPRRQCEVANLVRCPGRWLALEVDVCNAVFVLFSACFPRF